VSAPLKSRGLVGERAMVVIVNEAEVPSLNTSNRGMTRGTRRPLRPSHLDGRGLTGGSPQTARPPSVPLIACMQLSVSSA
jgi:hypothetical protein